MATVVLRFYGRFAFAEGRNPDDTPNGRITALAPNYESGGFDPHQVLMWIRRDTLVTSGPAGTDLAPSQRLVGEGPITEAEYFVWDLAGRTVRVQNRPIAELPASHGIADLAVLENLRSRLVNFDKAVLNGTTAGPTRAAIQLAGTGTTGAAFPASCVFVTRTDAIAMNPTAPEFGGKPAQFADVVEFEIGLNSIGPAAHLTLELTNPDGSAFSNHIVVKATTSVTIGFSNRCASLPKSVPFDLEFGQYYELLKNPQNDRLIPKEILGGGSVGDCDRLAYFPYK